MFNDKNNIIQTIRIDENITKLAKISKIHQDLLVDINRRLILLTDIVKEQENRINELENKLKGT